MNTQSKSIVNGLEEKQTTEVLRKSIWLIFPVNWWEKVSEKHIGNDIHIITEKPIRNIYFNGKKINHP